MFITELHASFAKKIILLASLSAILIACGPGDPKVGILQADDSIDSGSAETVCNHNALGFESPVVFNESDAGANIRIYAKGTTACFANAVPSGIRSNVAITPGSGYYYFEAKVGGSARIGVGTAAAPIVPNNAGNDEITRNRESVFVKDSQVELERRNDSTGEVTWTQVFAGDTHTYGFAIDYRGQHPIVYVVNKHSETVDCSTGTACAYIRTELEHVTTPIYIYAAGTGSIGSESFVKINTGTDIKTNAFSYPPLEVKRALREVFYRGDEGRGTGAANDGSIVTKWPQANQDAAPVVTRGSYLNAVIRIDDSAPYSSELKASAADADDGDLTSSIQWIENATVLGTGGSLVMSASLLNTLGVGEHQIEAVAADKLGLSDYKMYTVKVIASGANTDDDGDGLTYSQEKVLSTNPANPDTDDDGLSDAVETGFGYSPIDANSNGLAGFNDGQRRANDNSLRTVKLEIETATTANGNTPTSRGVLISEDGIQAAFTSDLNLDCVNQIGNFANFFKLEATADYPEDSSPFEMCLKRAVRASGGIKQGEFRYFEVYRLLANFSDATTHLDVFAPNVGQGFITPTGLIDPYCCVASSAGGGRIDDGKGRTPPSMSVNSLGSVWNQLVGQGNYNTLRNFYSGFAVDFTGAFPKVYVFLIEDAETVRDDTRTPITDPTKVKIFSYGGNPNNVAMNVSTWTSTSIPAIPFVYGHPESNRSPGVEVNFGLQKFHYDINDVVIPLLQARGVLNTASLKPGIGIHERPTTE